MHITPAPGIRLRKEQFKERARQHGLDTAAAIADHTGISRWAVTRVLSGECDPGVKFMARTCLAFPGVKLDDLFEVVADVAA